MFAFLPSLPLDGLFSFPSLAVSFAHLGGKKRYRLGYAVANACGVGLVVSIPGSVLWRNEAGEATVEWGELAAFGLAVAFSLLAFFAVQVSYPERSANAFTTGDQFSATNFLELVYGGVLGF